MRLTTGAIIKLLKDYPGDSTLDELWKDAELRKALGEIATYVKSQKQPRSGDSDTLKGQKQPRSRNSDALKSVKTTTKLPDPPAIWQTWGLNPSSFYSLGCSSAALPITDCLRRNYAYGIDVSRRVLGYSVVRRFISLYFFDVSETVAPWKKRLRQSTIDKLTVKLKATGVEQVDDGRLREWVREGRVYNRLCAAFGEGCLFFLPEASGWQHLHDAVDEVVAFLNKLGIGHTIQKHDATSVGRRIRQMLMSPILANFEHQSLSVQAGAEKVDPPPVMRQDLSTVQGVVRQDSPCLPPSNRLPTQPSNASTDIATLWSGASRRGVVGSEDENGLNVSGSEMGIILARDNVAERSASTTAHEEHSHLNFGASTSLPSPRLQPSNPLSTLNETVTQGATMIPDPDLGRVDEILAAAALRVDESTIMPMTVPDIPQYSSAGHLPVDEDGWHAPGNTSQQDQFTVGSGEFSSLSHPIDSSGTGCFGSSWVSETGSLGQDQYQSEINQLRRYVPDTISNHTGPPCKRLCLTHPIDDAAAVFGHHNDDQTAIIDSLTSIAGQEHLHSSERHGIAPSANTTSAPSTMTFLQQNDATAEDTRQDVNAYDDWAWDFIRDPNFWAGFEFPPTPAGDMDIWVSGPSYPVNNDPPSFPPY